MLTLAHRRAHMGKSTCFRDLRGFCEDCEAIFLLFIEMKKLIGRSTHASQGWAGVKIGILASQCSQVYLRVLPRGACGEGQARRRL